MAGRVRYLLQRGDGFWARIAVPQALRSIIGRRELLAPLGSNRKIAERDVHAVVAGFHDTLAEARARLEVSAKPPPRVRGRTLTTAQLAHTHFAEELASDQREREGDIRPAERPAARTIPSADAREWEKLSVSIEPAGYDDLAARNEGQSRLDRYNAERLREAEQWTKPVDLARRSREQPDTRYRATHVGALRRVASGRADDDEIGAVVGWAIDKFMERGSTHVERGTYEWRGLARTLAQVQLEALDAVATRDDGREPAAPKLPILAEPPTPVPLAASRQRGPSVPILDLLDGYLRKLKVQGKGAEAERRWRPVFKGLVRYLGHDDARHLSKADLSGWRDHLLNVEGRSPKTVRDVHLASLRTVLNWAVDEDKLTDNAAARVRLNVAKKVRTREKGFTDDEALAILKAADAYRPPLTHSPATRESSYVTNGKRWLPWLCALTGARVAEMAQLRGQDVQTRDGITFLRITPEAGSVKTGQFRDVPLHPQLVERGFLDLVKAAGDGPIFYDAAKPRKGVQHPSKIVANRVSGWVRDLGIAPVEVDPSHGWRHRFKTVGREVEISDRVLDALQGHASRTAGDDYGDVTLKARDRAIRKIPSYGVKI